MWSNDPIALTVVDWDERQLRGDGNCSQHRANCGQESLTSQSFYCLYNSIIYVPRTLHRCISRIQQAPSSLLIIEELVRFQKWTSRMSANVCYFKALADQDSSIDILSWQLAVWTVQNKWTVEKGQFRLVKIGTSNQTFLQTILTVCTVTLWCIRSTCSASCAGYNRL